MSKKIIAVSLAMLIMVIGLVGCTKKKETTTINGNEYLLMTDENGDPLINEDNKAVAIVTRSSGEYATEADGEPQTYLIKIVDTYNQNGYVYGEHYKMPIPDGWSIGTGNKLIKDGTDGNTYIEVVFIKELEEVDGVMETLESYLATVDDTNGQLAELFDNEEAFDNLVQSSPELAAYKGCKVKLGQSSTMMSGRHYSIRTYEIVDADGKTVHYAENYYTEDNGSIYQVSYVSVENVVEFDFASYLQDFTFVS